FFFTLVFPNEGNELQKPEIVLKRKKLPFLVAPNPLAIYGVHTLKVFLFPLPTLATTSKKENTNPLVSATATTTIWRRRNSAPLLFHRFLPPNPPAIAPPLCRRLLPGVPAVFGSPGSVLTRGFYIW
uniref:Uncharacterized protein n=1 Tax=Aegilops tauschii subsp. strangulata TaxID=200361 RepID=A0A453HUF1_AEGTS